MKLKSRVLKYIQSHGPARVTELSTLFKVSRQYTHRIILELFEEESIQKIGKSPHVYYMVSNNPVHVAESIGYAEELFLNQHFFLVDALGNIQEGLPAISYWCAQQKLALQKTIQEFITTRNKYLDYYNDEQLIDGLQKLKSTKEFNQIGLDQLYYLDFYAIERFGKTRLGNLMHFAKQGQNKMLMAILVKEIQNRILHYIEKHHIDAIAFIPPTIQRKIQFIDFLKNNLKVQKPIIQIRKISGSVVVPQKALSKISERIANAKNTFIVPVQKSFHHVLLIDDAVGSGATMNEVALKLKQKKLASKISGITISGSFKGFEVISEV